MNLHNYLQRISFLQPTAVSAETLIALHRAHVLRVPFENLDVIAKQPIIPDQECFYKKIVENRRGGICYELNGLFKALLDSFGFESYFISCNVFVPAIGSYGADFGHIAIIAAVKGEQYLVDVGFGDAFIEPLKLSWDVPQYQYGVYYRLSRLEKGEVLLEKSEDGIQYRQMFKFSLRPHALHEFAEMCRFHQESPLAPFNKQLLCTRPTPDGRITLTSKSLIVSGSSGREESVVKSCAEFDALLAQYFDMRLQPLSV
ncbi:arylamine N-acetyltransferase [Cesiribacter sp. SM1]|uniref:arylamine N-acetyltransferase family protein n=1 Tax=Cesiribacter sp. SM1 TaxID=2861196 RepID=UPI001CD3AEDA|nr:arylamine N-acetyltransferase [Cesiribacter sp. SM1]